MAQNSHIEAIEDGIYVNGFIMDFKLTDDQVDNQSDIIDSSEKNKTVKQRTRRNIGQKSKLLVGKILIEPSLEHAANLLLNLSQKTISNSLVGQPFAESSQMFEQPLATQQRPTDVENTLQTLTNDKHCTQPSPDQMSKETSDISRLMSSPPQRSVSRSVSMPIYKSDSSNFTPRRHSNYLTDLEADKNSDALQLVDIHEQLAVQNCYTNRVLEQQRQLEVYVKEKMENLDQGISLIMRTLGQRERQINYKVVGTVEHYYEEMPKLPISKQENVILLNYGLRNSDYMNKFVTHLSPLVKISKRSTRKSIYSIMGKMFSINLLLDYSWTGTQNTFTKAAFPFSSLDGILKLINHMLGRYSSGIEIEKELKELLRCVPRIYCDVLKKQHKEK